MKLAEYLKYIHQKHKTMSDKFLVVYNTCELRQNNLFWYIDCLKNILNQNYDNFQVIVSGCKITNATKSALQKSFGKNILYNYMDDIYPVNITFNKTVIEAAKRCGPFDGFVYVDSGVNVRNQTNCLQEIYNRSKTKQFGMLSLQASNDNGYPLILGLPDDHFFRGNDFIVPIGKCCNLHFQYFDNKLLEFYGKLMPDIFVAFCTESTFSFLNAALNLKWAIIKDIILDHFKSTDGATVGFDHRGPRGEFWNNLYGGADVHDLITNSLAIKYGLGYEEPEKIMMHNPNAYTEEGFAKYSELKFFIKENLFIKKDVLNYDDIKCDFII